ncbi:uncharacterized protein LOC112501843 isoform X2 [Cynara cardunculus var. scolymus]|uniref:uncharacterized protein LOC112501843 isoform X2 n=1 Tax=Cynara cardunculus var. scolymus TaxID=59895 RepID=UPI000D62BD4D|nr:uncharacterized protein LOC112501843 isoform X2 [Cynara cardunculus var. scolymus]
MDEAPARETGGFSRVVAPLLPLHDHKLGHVEPMISSPQFFTINQQQPLKNRQKDETKRRLSGTARPMSPFGLWNSKNFGMEMVQEAVMMNLNASLSGIVTKLEIIRILAGQSIKVIRYR